MRSLDEIERERLLFLRRLYELSEGNHNKIFYIWSIGEHLGFSSECTTKIAQYLDGEGLLRFRVLGGGVSITHEGIKLAEKAQINTPVQKEVHTPKQMPQQKDIDTNGTEQFLKKIDEESSWKFIEIRACLIRFPDFRWRLTFLHIELLVDKTSHMEKKFENEHLKIIREIRPVDSLRDLAYQVVHERKLTIGGEAASAELTNGKWGFEIKLRSRASEDLKIDYPCFFTSSHGNYPEEMGDIERKLKEILPLKDTEPYMDLRHACNLILNGEHGTAAYGISYQLIAPIYAKLENAQFNDREVRIDLHSYNGFLPHLRAVLFGLNENGSPNDYRITVKDFNKENVAESYSGIVPSDPGSTSLIARVFFKSTLVEEVQIEKEQTAIDKNFWSKTLVERIDPDLNTLKSWLEGENLSKQAEKFERAVSILLFMCNLRSAHVGGDYEEDSKQIRRSKHKKTSVNTDVLSMTSDDSIIFVCQCTTDWNIDKVASILDITNELTRRLSVKKKPIIQPVIITQIGGETITDNLKKAEERKVKVVTIEGLRMLLQEIRQNNVPYKIAMNILSLN